MLTFIIYILIIHSAVVFIAIIGKKKDFAYPLALMVTLAILSNILANKIIVAGKLSIPGGVLVFSATYLLSNIISEFWGKKYTKIAIWSGFMANAVAAVATYFTITLPTPSYAIKIAESFNIALGMTPRIIFASFFSFVISQYFDLFSYFFIKRLTNNKHLWLRNAFSTFVSQLISTSLFVLIAFWGIFPIGKMFASLLSMKIILLFIDVPFIYFTSWLLKKKIKADIWLEKGQQFGQINSLDFNKIYHNNTTIIQWACECLPQAECSIADYGGGNGIVSKDLIDKMINLEFKNFSIDNIEIDQTKFVNYQHLKNINQNVLNYKISNHYDLSICKLLMHYFDNDQQKSAIKNIFNNAKSNGYLILANFVYDSQNDYNLKRKILDYIEQTKHIQNRAIPTTVSLEEAITQAGFKIIKEEKIFYTISINDFYKNRFDLSDDDLEKIKKIIGAENHNETMLTILAKK